MPIKIKHIWKSYGEQRVLADFSLTVEDGEKICLMGASGIGKNYNSLHLSRSGKA